MIFDFFKKNKKKEIIPPVKKYTVKPVRELQSKFEINQEARRRAEKILDDEQKQKDYEEMINVSIISYLFSFCAYQLLTKLRIDVFSLKTVQTRISIVKGKAKSVPTA